MDYFINMDVTTEQKYIYTYKVDNMCLHTTEKDIRVIAPNHKEAEEQIKKKTNCAYRLKSIAQV